MSREHEDPQWDSGHRHSVRSHTEGELNRIQIMLWQARLEAAGGAEELGAHWCPRFDPETIRDPLPERTIALRPSTSSSDGLAISEIIKRLGLTD